MAILEDKKRIEVTDVSEINGDLLKKSTAQLESEINQRLMALNELKRREEEKNRAAEIEEIAVRQSRVVEDLKWLYARNSLSTEVVNLFMARAKGKGEEMVFSPHLRFRAPRK